ncbi:radical SAM protein [Afifella sp. H1R]|uniref:B12-binding domain-containing radical SAM protein n=1 Tax=Afifella sp. H1R TaxID=2908841 RepID=UPI001F35BD3B|nr:radical SAM protein [Afifella sp. H1R]MCF1505814.1 radical SAM protein [Afifella sp. H1R]
MTAPDLHLIFPPQWSPFQPFLSTPSLKAYLESHGHRVRQSDWNVEFYEYFIDRRRLAKASARLMRYIRELREENEIYRNSAYLALGILSNYETKRSAVDRLRSPACLDRVEDFYESVTALKRLLYAFSVAEPVVEVGTSSLSTARVLRSAAAVDAFCESEEDNPFLPFFRSKIAEIDEVPRYFGISVIGTEQILPSLTLGAALKARFPGVPILVGGSVFSRLLDREDALQPLFGRFFDIVVRYEGEIPADRLLSATDPCGERTPGIAFHENGRIVMTDLAPQLPMEEIPTPDFGDLDLRRYFSPDIVLPLLSARGCYWDKCAFCYHGMIYGDRYRVRDPKAIAADVERLNARHGVTHFALNDEAIPPKLFKTLPAALPRRTYFFTGLYKFERFFRAEHYRDMYEAGFRSLYIGLESASERVQRHMRKNNTRAVMRANLTDADAAGIWNHTFNFFGFPTETEAEAMETAHFLIDNSAIIHSEGTGTFSFEHNAPIAKSPEAFGVSRVVEKTDSILELYYDYEVESGLTQADATRMLERFSEMKRQTGAYRYGGWIPREHLLLLLARHERDALRTKLADLDSRLDEDARWRRDIAWFALQKETGSELRFFVVNTHAGTILETNRDAVLVLEFMPQDVPLKTIVESFPALAPVLTHRAEPVSQPAFGPLTPSSSAAGRAA